MDDFNSKLHGYSPFRRGYVTFCPRNVTTSDIRALHRSGWINVEMYWRRGGFPVLMKDFVTLRPNTVLRIDPVGDHDAFLAAQFINRRAADVLEFFMYKAEGDIVRYFDVDMREKWKLGAEPRTPPDTPNSAGDIRLFRFGG